VERGGTGQGSTKTEPHFSKGPGPDLASEFADAERFGYFVKLKKPVIAAINGPCAGIGMVMALYADLRFAADSAVFTTAFAQRGLIAEHGISWLLPRLIGQAQAMDLLLSARRVSAEEAKAIGLVNAIFPAEKFLDSVIGYARMLAETVSPRSMAVMKAQVWKANFQDFNAALASADAEMVVSLSHSEFKEGVAHFLEKRKPRFADL
jgi:enoyl-CoA hydratase/carnithine racemase